MTIHSCEFFQRGSAGNDRCSDKMGMKDQIGIAIFFANFLWYFNLLSICLIVHNCIKMHTWTLIDLLGWCLTLYTQYSNRSALSAGCDGYTCISNDFFQMLHVIQCFAVESLTLVHNLTFLISIEIKGT